MHLYDPNGEIAEYRRKRVRHDNYLVLLFTIGFACFMGAGAFLYLAWRLPR